MEGTWTINLAQPRGLVFDATVRANYQLGRRMARDFPIKTDQVDGWLAQRLMESLGDAGAPSDRRVREWVQEEPGYPEKVIRSGIISKNDVIPELHCYLKPGNSGASMGQVEGSQPTDHTAKSPVSGRVNQEASPGSWGAELMKIGLCIGAIVLIGKAVRPTRSLPPNWSQANDYCWDRRRLRHTCLNLGRGNF
jgi:hypothetical protein